MKLGISPIERVIAGALAGLLIAGCSQEPSPLPDVVLITLDTTRADHLGVYGYTRSVSPSIDAFARDAVVYQLAWSTAPWTLPSHASMLTAKYPTSHGAHYDAAAGNSSLTQVLPFVPRNNFRVNRLGEGEVTLAELLGERGYATAAFAGGPWLAPEFGLLQGYAIQDAHTTQLAGRPAAELTERASRWLRSVPKSRPLHLFVNYFDAHHPYQPREGYRNLPPPDVDTGDQTIRAEIDAYDGEILYMDRHVGRLLEALREVGRYHESLIIIVSDHGEFFGEHGQFRHGPWLYEEVLRVALMIHLPEAREAGTVVTTPVSVVDLLPLVAAEVGFDLPAGVEGVMPGTRDYVVAESRPYGFSLRKYGDLVNRDLTAVIRWPWKLIASSRGERELYRIDRDPEEAQNLAGAEQEQLLSRKLVAIRAAFKPPKQPAAPEGVPPATEDILRGLGYIE